MKVKVNAAAENTHTAAGTRAAYLADAKSRLQPLADSARDRSSAYASQAAEALAPALAAAKLRARGGYEDVVPRIADALENLVSHPNTQEAQARGLAALQALRGDLTLSKKERKRLQKEQLAQVEALRKSAEPVKVKKGKKGLFSLLLLGVLGGLGFVAWKKFMAPSDSDWQAHTASSYQPTTTSTSQSFGEPVDAPANEAAAPVDRSKYGADAYVGAEPPAGFAIKGNERSMKYHTPETGGYERTIADVWFASEEAAEKAGFSKAQR